MSSELGADIALSCTWIIAVLNLRAMRLTAIAVLVLLIVTVALSIAEACDS